MSQASSWLPALVLLDHGIGTWAGYFDLVYGEFHRDFIQSQPKYQGRWVRCRRDPIRDGKEAGFWHCVCGGEQEADQIPQPCRCERIRWVRAMIERPNGTGIESWQTTRGGDIRHVLWYEESFAVVLAERTRSRDGFRYYQLITAYCTDRHHTIERLRRERDRT